jgi:predicted transcriptional regulator
MATTQKPGLSDEQLVELEKIARAQERPVEAVLAEAIDRYVKDMQWQGLKSYGRAKAQGRGIKPSDVQSLVADSRKENGL